MESEEELPKQVVIQGEKTLLEGFINLKEITLQFTQSDGQLSPVVRRIVADRGDAVAAVLWLREPEGFLLVRQFRLPAWTRAEEDGWLTELVAGSLKPTEDAEACIRREIVEETGYEPLVCEHIYSFYTSPGGLTEQIHLFLAITDENHRISEKTGLEEENEDIELVFIAAEDLTDLLAIGFFCDAKTLIGLQWAAQNMEHIRRVAYGETAQDNQSD